MDQVDSEADVDGQPDVPPPDATLVDSNPTFSRNSFRSTFRLPPNRVTQASADRDIALAAAAAAAVDAVEASIAADSATCDSGLEESPAAADAEPMALPRSSASPRLAEGDNFNQAASEFERQSVLLPSADSHQFAVATSTVARQQQPVSDRVLLPGQRELEDGRSLGAAATAASVAAAEDKNLPPRFEEPEDSTAAASVDNAEHSEEVLNSCEEPLNDVQSGETLLAAERTEEDSMKSQSAGRASLSSTSSSSCGNNKVKSPTPSQLPSAASTSSSVEQQQQQLRKQEDRIRRLTSENARLQTELDSCRLVFREFDRCLRLVADRKRESDAQTLELLRDRDQALEDLQSVEKAFSDLYKRFEKSKLLVKSLRENELALMRTVQEHQARMKRNEQKYQTLKAHAEEKLEAANRHIDEQRRANEAELARLQAVLRKAELQAQNLQAQLDQKVQENAELTSICDELINRVGDDQG